jgi:hypothetical protein
MVLAAFGTNVSEAAVASRTQSLDRGTPIDELERLARDFHLPAEIQDATVEQLRDILAEGKLPIAFIDRAILT